MFFNREKVFGFGKKESLSPSEALRKLYDTDDEVAAIIDSFVAQRNQVLAFDDVIPQDRNLLENAEIKVIETLAEYGIDISHETFDELMKGF